ncbi:hypothetical protein HanIR_Chr16g0836021 [Helianthus annuus]|nr:hypothetical protein HanIR_Chr16g0836021 [Helianthus annuus]
MRYVSCHVTQGLYEALEGSFLSFYLYLQNGEVIFQNIHHSLQKGKDMTISPKLLILANYMLFVILISY